MQRSAPFFICIALVALFVLASRTGIAQAAQLLSVTAQQVPNGHTRVLIQFDRGVALRLVPNVASNTVVLQAVGSMIAPGVPSFFPLNTGNVENLTAVFANGGLRLTTLLFSAAQASLAQTANNSYIIDVPPGAGGNGGGGYSQYPANRYQQPAPAAPPYALKTTRMFRLRYADVAEVVGLLAENVSISPSNTFNPQPNQFGTSPFSGGAFGQTGTFGTFGQFGNTLSGYQGTFGGFQNQGYAGTTPENALSQRVNESLAIDRRLNAIIVTGTPQQMQQAEDVIKLVDVPVLSVLIDAEILEITDTGEKALGLNYGQSPTTPITRIFNTQYQLLNGVAANAVPGAVSLATDIFLLVSKGQARVLASPKILTEDRLPASIVTGDSLPIRITTPVGVGGVGAVTSQVEYVNVGVNLQILPRITGEHSIETDLFSQVSSVTSFNASGDPQISSRQAQTRVNLLEGQTLVIGGLLQSRDIRNLQKIPIIGDIPLIGALFRFYTETRQNTNLVITITPHIVPLPQQMQQLPPGVQPTPLPQGPTPPPPAPQNQQ